MVKRDPSRLQTIWLRGKVESIPILLLDVTLTLERLSCRCISLEDDPTMVVHTLRMWFIGIGLTSFAAVLGQIVSSVDKSRDRSES